MKKQMIKISSLLFVMVAMMLSACDDYLDAVSYTHLDVYKRQVQESDRG